MKILGVDLGLKWMSFANLDGSYTTVVFRQNFIRGIHLVELYKREASSKLETRVDCNVNASPGIAPTIRELAFYAKHHIFNMLSKCVR